MADGILVKELNAWFGDAHILHDIGLAVAPKAVTALIGPSGCGKSTFIRCLNRMHEVVPGARVSGTVRLDGEDIYAPGVDPVQIRRRIGMVFQKPNPFPTMSIFDNVVAGLRLGGMRERAVLHEAAERALRQAALWDEVKDHLSKSGVSLSGRPAAAAVHRAGPGGGAGSAADGRAVLGARPDRHRQDRGADPRAAGDAHHRHRHAQHAAGRRGCRRRPASSCSAS